MRARSARVSGAPGRASSRAARGRRSRSVRPSGASALADHGRRRRGASASAGRRARRRGACRGTPRGTARGRSLATLGAAARARTRAHRGRFGRTSGWSRCSRRRSRAERYPQARARRVVDDPRRFAGLRRLETFGLLAGGERRDELADALPQLRRRRLGEGDHEHAIERYPAREQEIDDEQLDGERLARAGRRFDDRRAIVPQLREHFGFRPRLCLRLRRHGFSSTKIPQRRAAMARASAGSGGG